MKQIHLIIVGKLKDKNLLSLEQTYIKRINSVKVNITEIKASSEDKEQEGKLILQKISNLSKGSFNIILLSEHGKQLSSESFSQLVYNDLLTKFDNIFFVIGGAEGHGQQIIKESNSLLSLSPKTFPHQIARVLFTEQLYRAQTIFQGHPYHN